MRNGHVTTSVNHWSSGVVAKKIDEQLFFPLDSVFTPVLPKTTELLVGH